MGKATTEQEKLRQAKARLRRIQHFEQVTHHTRIHSTTAKRLKGAYVVNAYKSNGDGAPG